MDISVKNFSDRQYVRQAIEQNGIRRSPPERIVSRNGAPLKWIFDLRPIMLDPELLDRLSGLILDCMPENGPIQIGGMEVAAIPIVIACILKAHKTGRESSGFIIRKERKTTGLGRIIEGEIKSNIPIVIVDDIINSAENLERAFEILENEGHAPTKVIVIVDFNSKQAQLWKNKRKISFTSLFRLSDFGISNHRTPLPDPDVEYVRAWSFTEPLGHPFSMVPKSTPIVNGDQIIFGTDGGQVISLDLEQGKKLWEHKIENCGRKGIWSSPIIYNNYLYIGAYNGSIYCLNASNGNKLWSNAACEWIGSSPVIVPQHNLLIIGLEYERPGHQGSMAAFDLVTGEKIWEHWLRVYQHGSAAYWAEGDLAIAGTNDHSLIALNAADGSVAWEHPTDRSIKYAPAVDAARRLVASASFDGGIRISDAATGRLLHHLQTDDVCYSTPLFHGDRVFCGSGDRKMHVLDVTTGQRVGAIECGARVYSSPRSIGRSVLFGASNGIVRDIDAETLRLRGAFTVPDAVTNALAIADEGRLVVAATYTNGLFAFRRREV